MSGIDDIMPDGVPQDGTDDALAMDYALGALDGAAMRAAELRLRRDLVFAANVAAWQRQLAPLAQAVPPVPPQADVWSSIDRELFRAPAAAAATPTRAGWANVGFWRNLAIGMTGVAAVALGLLVLRPSDEAAPSRTPVAVPANNGRLLAASMASTEKDAAVVLTATYDPDRGQVVLTPAAPENKRGLTPQLWVIVGKNPPKSLGTIDLNGTQAVKIPDDMRAEVKNGATLAISLEQPGGSPTGAPTGPIVATGTLGAI